MLIYSIINLTSGGDNMDHTIPVKSMLEFVENRVKDKLLSVEVAESAGFSHSHFRAIFKNLTGMSLAKYISLRRLNHAAFELIHSKKSISDIAMGFYYNSHDAFSRAFKREFGETPSEFRKNKRRVSGKLIVPGVFGPVVDLMEGRTLKKINTDNECILYGVPKVSYIDSYELTPFISSLKACLNYMGQKMSYAKLMAASGAAFRLIWNAEYWDGGNVDILGMREDPLEPVLRALKAAGREFEILLKKESPLVELVNKSGNMNDCISEGEKADFLKMIRKEIDAGKPLIGFGIIGPPEACIITGYKNGGKILTGWNFFQDMPEFSANLSYESCGYFIREGWYEHPDTYGLMAIGPQKYEIDDQVLLEEILRYAIDIMNSEKVYNRTSGFNAFSAWETAIMDDREFPKDAPLPMLMERLMCQIDAMSMLGEGRWFAAEYFDEIKEFVSESKMNSSINDDFSGNKDYRSKQENLSKISEEIKTIIQRCKEQNKIVHEMAKILEGFGMGEKQARNLGIREKQVEIAELISKASDNDKSVLVELKKTLGKLS